MDPRARARYLSTGILALTPKAFGVEYDVVGGGSGVAPKAFEEVGSIAAVCITGPLEQHPHYFWDDYESIEGRARAAFASSSRAVALRINSPGGAAAGCFELARSLRAMADDSGKPLGVFVDGCAASAAFAIACAATAGIWAPPTSTVASLAVYETIVDQTALDAAMGLKFLFIPSSGADLKLAGNSHVPASEAVVQHTQTQVDLLTDLFYALIEEMRGVPQAQTRALRGAALLASQGAENGLIDGLRSWSEFLSELEAPEKKPMKNVTALAALALAASAGSRAAKATDDEWKALRTLAESEDEDKRKAAKKMLAAMTDGDGEGGGEGGEESDEDKKARAEKEEKEEQARAAAAATGAQASSAGAAPQASANEIKLAQRVQALETSAAEKELAGKRAALLAQRPDFSAEVRATLASANIEVLEKAVATWPRVNVDPRAAAAAATPGFVPGQLDSANGGIRPEHQAMLDRIGRSGVSAKQARIEGSALVLDPMSPESAAKRMKDMVEQGIAPSGPQDFARISNSEFKVKK